MGPAAHWAYGLQQQIRAGIAVDPAEVQACIVACKEESRHYRDMGVLCFVAAGIMAVALFVAIWMVMP